MDSARVLETFLDLVRIDSPSRHEAAIAFYCKQRLERLGFHVVFDDSQAHTGSDTGNLIANLAGTTCGHLALSAHMDCVMPCVGVTPRIVDGTIYSDGTTILGGDDKAGIAAILEAVECVVEAGIARPDITIIFSVCEELGVFGANFLPDDLFVSPVLCLVLDAEKAPGCITTGAPYHYVFIATFHGVAAHAGVEPEKGISAITMAATAVTTMKWGRIDEQTTANVGLIEGGRAFNIVPDTCTLRGECRSINQERVVQVKDDIDQALREGAAARGGTVDVQWELSYPGIYYPVEDLDVTFLLDVARDLGLEACTDISGGGSDANVLAAKGAKPIALGTGMTDFHALSESLKVRDLEDCARYVEAIIGGFAGRVS